MHAVGAGWGKHREISISQGGKLMPKPERSRNTPVSMLCRDMELRAKNQLKEGGRIQGQESVKGGGLGPALFS